jgi:hypothetical protein
MPKKKTWHFRVVVDDKPVTKWEEVGHEDWEPESRDAAYDAAHDMSSHRIEWEVKQL